MLRQLLVSRPRSSSDDDRGFTVLELMVVVVIIALLATGLSIFVGNQKQLAVDAQTTSDVRNAANALERWQASNVNNTLDKGQEITSNDNLFGIKLSSNNTKMVVNRGPVPYTYIICGYNAEGSDYVSQDKAANYNSYRGGMSRRMTGCSPDTVPNSVPPTNGGGTSTPPVVPSSLWKVETISGGPQKVVEGPDNKYYRGNSGAWVYKPNYTADDLNKGVLRIGDGFMQANDSLYVSQTSGDSFKVPTSGGSVLTVFARRFTDGLPTSFYNFSNPDNAGNVYVTQGLTRLCEKKDPAKAVEPCKSNPDWVSWTSIFKIDSTGKATNLMPAPAEVWGNKTNMKVGPDNNLYFSTSGDADSPSQIWKIDTSTKKSVLIAGDAKKVSGTPKLPSIIDFAFSSTGKIYAATTTSLLSINSDGSWESLAGRSDNLGFNDGTGSQAQFSRIKNLVITPNNNYIYVLDDNKIREIDTVNVVRTVAGSDSSGYVDGTGDKAKFKTNSGLFSGQYLAADNKGNLYLADSGNDSIRKISPL